MILNRAEYLRKRRCCRPRRGKGVQFLMSKLTHCHILPLMSTEGGRLWFHLHCSLSPKIFMAGPSVCGSRTLCECCRSLLEKHGLLHQLCNYADLSSEEPASGLYAPGLMREKQHVTTDMHDKWVPSGKPYFTSIVTKCQLQHPFALGVPTRFYKYLPHATVPVILSCRGRSWEMWYAGMFFSKRIYRGWKKFAIDNNLKMGDACVYELMDSEKLNFRVHILSGKIPREFAFANEGEHIVKIIRDADNECEEKKIEKCVPNAMPNTEPFISDCAMRDKTVPLTGNPYFTFIVTKSHLKKPFHLTIPKWFVRFLPDASVPVVLTCRKRSWDVTYTGDRSKKVIRCGMKQFVLDNNLKLGDGCVYELTDEDNPKFQVQILSGDIPSELRGAIGKTTDTPMMID